MPTSYKVIIAVLLINLIILQFYTFKLKRRMDKFEYEYENDENKSDK